MQLTPKRKTALIAFLAFDALLVVALVLLFLLRGDRETASDLRDIGVTVYPEARALSDFRLLDEQGAFFSRNDFQGHWNLVFFGFTHCPDICPLTMAELKQFYENLGDDLVKPRIFLVTVDPLRDNPESMAAYVNSYNEDFIGLSGDPVAIDRLASELYVGFSEVPSADSLAELEQEETEEEGHAGHGNYLIEHSGHIAIIDPDGDYYAVMRAPHRDRDMISAYRVITQ